MRLRAYRLRLAGRPRRAARAVPGDAAGLITENGCAYKDDSARVVYLDAHVRPLRTAMDAGVDVQGYCQWSLIDNWGWAEGITTRFGLVHVDYATRARTPKPPYC